MAVRMDRATFVRDCRTMGTNGNTCARHIAPQQQIDRKTALGLLADSRPSPPRQNYRCDRDGCRRLWHYLSFAQPNMVFAIRARAFPFFDDNAGWLQIDKVGHAWTAYIESYYTAELYRWAGVPHRPSAWIGAGAGFLFQAGLETLDGFSEGWGASVGDVAANTAGALLMAGQMAAWNEQRIWLKFSAKHQDYSQLPPEVQARAQNLYGGTLPERMLKDYNGQSYWLSVNPSAFMPSKTRFPKWLNIAVGYGAGGMLGAERNRWELPDGTMYDYTQWQRYRQYYLSVDIDLTRLPIRSRFWRTALGMLNIIKIPAPALEYNSKGEWKLHALYW
jgi:hypothetical protein